MSSESVEEVIAKVRRVYGSWKKDTSVSRMRSDWEQLFSLAGDASFDPTTINGVPCAWITAAGARSDRVIVYLHGGGFKVGSIVSHRELMGRLSRESHVTVLGVNYRLAPENRYPSALLDAVTVIRHLVAQGLKPGDIALAGDSAGAGLALSAMLYLQDRHGIGLAAAYLMSAWTDLLATGPSYETKASSDPIHQRPMILAMARDYLSKEGDPRDPYVSPLYADASRLKTLPPILMQVGERETVLSDSELFAEKVTQAGGMVICHAWLGMIHVFQQFPQELPEALRAVREGGQFLSKHLTNNLPGGMSL